MSELDEGGIMKDPALSAGSTALSDKNEPPSAFMDGKRAAKLEQLKDGFDPNFGAGATNDLDLDEVNDNVQDDAGDDDVSLEVNFGGGDSCRASDVSSLSFQNVVLDDTDNDIPDSVEIEAPSSLRDSGDSSDSLPNDFPTDSDPQAFSGALEEEIKRQSSQRESDLDKTLTDEEILNDEYHRETGTIKRKSKSRGESVDSNEDRRMDNSDIIDALITCSNETGSSKSGLTEHAQHRKDGKLCDGAFKDKVIDSDSGYPASASNRQLDVGCNNDIDIGESNRRTNSGNVVGGGGGKHVEDHNIDRTASINSTTSGLKGSVPSIDQAFPPPSQPQHLPLKKRNSLEVRNNIPNINTVKNYDYDTDSIGELSRFTAGQGAVPKMKKKSPGLARRLNEPDRDRDTSSSEKEVDPLADLDNSVISAQKMFEQQLQVQLRTGGTPSAGVLAALNKSLPQATTPTAAPLDSYFLRESSPGKDVENEYDYVKYARIQSGDSYVGMRLAYSTSNDSLDARNKGLKDDQYLGSSREASPEKHNHGITYDQIRANSNRVAEDTLTEIPLNGSDVMTEERKEFSLSPEATECDSAEVESIVSEEGKSSTSGMPMVEDGLSSSQGSDTEDTSTMDTHRPSEILKRRKKLEIEHEMQQVNQVDELVQELERQAAARAAAAEAERMQTSGSGSSRTSTMSREYDPSRRDVVDTAIRDIKTAIEKSKNMQLKSPREERERGEDPVWVMRPPGSDSGSDMSLARSSESCGDITFRDSYVRKIQRQEEMRKVREEIERQQEEDYRSKEAEHVYELGEEQNLLKCQFSRNDGKSYAPGKGYDSDDEYDEDAIRKNKLKDSRWTFGGTYGKVPLDSEDSILDSIYSQKHFSPSLVTGMINRQNSQSESSLNRTVTSPSSNSSVGSSRFPQSASSSSGFHSGVDSRYSPSSDNVQYPASNSRHDNQAGGQSVSRYINHVPRSQSSHAQLSGAGAMPYHDDETLTTHPFLSTGQPGEFDTDEETDDLLDNEYKRSEKVDIPELTKPPVNRSAQAEKRRTRAKQVALRNPENETVLIEGVLFRARYLGSTQLISEGQPSKAMRMMQAQEAVGRIKAPEGENQPSTEVDLFVSSEKIMVLNTDLQEIMMDHSLRTISYIADIGDIVVIMARRRTMVTQSDIEMRRKRQSKILCHVFESEEAGLIAQSIGQAFQVAYMEFLKANGIEDTGLMKEMDYQEVLNQQEIFGEELYMFSNKEMQKEVIVPKLKGEPLGVVIVESGWGSMVPTVVLANMSPSGAAARCGQLNIGDQIMSINGISLVGLPLSACQNYVKAAKNQTVVKLTVVSCAPVVEVLIKRPDVKYQLGFSVQNGVICSLLRGGIAERGGVRVGHRIIEINGQSVVAVPHEKIVNMLATSVGEIHMKTMPTSIYRLLTGQEAPSYM